MQKSRISVHTNVTLFLRRAIKLASGTAPGRLRDLGDVQELIRILELPADFSDQLNPFVRDLYSQLWKDVQQIPPES